MKKRIFAIVLCFVLTLAMSVPVFASSGSDTTASFDTLVKPIFDEITAQLSITNIVAMIAAVIGAGIGFVFLWWAVRKGISVLMSAVRKGKVSS